MLRPDHEGLWLMLQAPAALPASLAAHSRLLQLCGAPARARCQPRERARAREMLTRLASRAQPAAVPEAKASLRSQKGSAFKVRRGCSSACASSRAVHCANLAVGQVRRVLDVIRGRDYEEALMILEFLPQKCSESVRSLLRCHVASLTICGCPTPGARLGAVLRLERQE